MDSDSRKISICLTHFNRSDMIERAIEKVIDDPRVSEIVIVDDHSDEYHMVWLKAHADGKNKIRIVWNESNLGCYRNKREAISHAKNEWCMIWDSDNIFDKPYIDHIYAYGLWDKNTIYAPSKAKPFDYTAFEGRILTKMNISKFVGKKLFDAMMNTMNYFVNRDEYLRVWDSEAKPYAIDSIYQNLQWIAAGNKFFVVPGMEYEHTIHTGSLYMAEGHLTQDLHTVIMNKFKQMK
ncbi:MAG TPA: glycosyltransferase family 2 protein [Nitrososphaeraceae archaeon]|nr:glycosyltransferase family 2 protein [Nitrososphaeraceae archaeon]